MVIPLVQYFISRSDRLAAPDFYHAWYANA